MLDLSSLSAGERDVLALFAEGHTAKSVASMTGLSVAAVNERLRAARRKTGIGSSRELARELRLQENRDEEIELFPSSEPTSQPTLLNTNLVGRRLIMPVLMIAAMASAALMMQRSHSPTPAEPTTAISKDPLLEGMVEQQTVPEMHDRVRGEGRDVAWASRTESALLTRYASVRRADSVREAQATSLPSPRTRSCISGTV
ncbi:MAG: hypothetical protein EOO77_31505, partial [Oxalobacteraceae bacterium]